MPEGDAADPMAGATCLGDGINVIDIWQGLHANAIAWQAIPPDDENADQNRDLMDETDLSLLKALATYPAANWSSLCHAAGWTAYGAVGLSWCKEATLAEVVDGWRRSGFVLTLDPAAMRPARLLNPALIPQTRRLSELATAAKPDPFALCVMIAHSEKPLEFDLPHASLANVQDPQLAAFLNAQMANAG